MKVGTKVVTVTVAAIILTGLVSIFLKREVVMDQGEKEAHKHFSAVMDQAHTIIEEFSHLNQKDAFRTETLTEEALKAEDYRDTTLYRTIPVVASWDSVKHVAEKEGLHFHVARENPRNPDHEPTEKER